MLNSKPDLPRFARILNSIGSRFKLDRLKFASLNQDILLNAAVKQTGLTDFGPVHYQEGLRRLLKSAEKDANLNLLGRVFFHKTVLRILINRLKMTETFKQKPYIFNHPMIPPIIILGFPRTGTTFLHRMMIEDHAHYGIPLWKMRHLFPENPEKSRKDIDKATEFRVKLKPELDSIHYVRADTPEECMVLQMNTFDSFLFWAHIPVYGYLDWYCSQNHLESYKEYGSLLQAFQSEYPSLRFILKSPVHMGAITSLLKVVPEALIIHTHRHPVPVCNSFNNMIYCFHSISSDKLNLSRMAQKNIDTMAGWVGPSLAVRDANPNRIYDVYYDNLIADPVGTVRGIYNHFGLTWSHEYEKLLQIYIRKNPKDKFGKHYYKSEDFRITDKIITNRFAEYIERFGF